MPLQDSTIYTKHNLKGAVLITSSPYPYPNNPLMTGDQVLLQKKGLKLQLLLYLQKDIITVIITLITVTYKCSMHMIYLKNTMRIV